LDKLIFKIHKTFFSENTKIIFRPKKWFFCEL